MASVVQPISPEMNDVKHLELQCICMDSESKRDRFEPRLRRYLLKHRDQLRLNGDGDPVGDYVYRVWPNGMPGTMIVSNTSHNEHLLLLIRPPADGPLAGSFAAGRWAVAFIAHRKKGRLVICGFQLVPHVPPCPWEAVVTGPVFLNPTDQWMNAEDLTRLATLERRGEAIAELIRPWRECLDWQEGITVGNQLSLRYERWWPEGETRISFRLRGRHDPEHLKRRAARCELVVAPISASKDPERWIADPDYRMRFLGVGAVVSIKPDSAENPSSITLVVEADEAAMTSIREDPSALPGEGFLLAAIGGDLGPIKNEKNALKRLQENRGYSPGLVNWLLGTFRAAVPENIPDLFAGDASSPLNPEQRAAVNKAMAALVSFFLFGPPGTGKTIVAAEIAHRVILEKCRVLLTAQTNLAVENIMGRLPHIPEIRPLRVGKSERVGEGFRDYLEEKAAGWWLRGPVSSECRRRVEEYQDIESGYGIAQAGLAALGRIDAEAAEYNAQVAAAETKLAELRRQRDIELNDQKQAEAECGVLLRRLGAVRDVIPWVEAGYASSLSGELLDGTPLAERLTSLIAQVSRVLAEGPWSPSWWPNSPPAGSAAATRLIPQVRLAQITTTAVEAPLVEALAMCRGAALDHNPEEDSCLRELRAEKARLVDSASPEDMERLAAINRQLHQRRQGRWAELTRSIGRSLDTMLGGARPAELDALTSSLRPEAALSQALEQLLTLVGRWREGLAKVLDDARPGLRTEAVRLAASLEDDLATRRAGIAAIGQRIAGIDDRLAGAAQGIDEARSRQVDCQARWVRRWPDVVPDLKGRDGHPGPMGPDVLTERRAAIDAWLQSRVPDPGRLRRWRDIQGQWLERIAHLSAADEEQLRPLYVQHANVVGATCNQAGQREFHDRPDFEPFDVVIVDEVSKATLPELIMPLMLGYKGVLIGDHRQLPPMFKEHDSTFTEAAAEGQIDAEKVNHRFRQILTASHFERLFAAAPAPLKHSLVVQYRMHPQIMAVVNRFYGGRLAAAGDTEALAARRNHRLSIRDRRGGRFLEPGQAVLWVDSSRDQHNRPAFEVQRGTSKANPLEVKLTLGALELLAGAMTRQGYGPPQRFTAGSEEDGVTLKACLTRLVRAAPETLADVFDRRQVLLNGRPARPDAVVRAGDRLDVDLRKPVGVITFYGAQLGDIRTLTRRRENAERLAALNLLTNTVDRFQGMECPIVLVSLVRSRQCLRGGEFVKQYQRINVAFSRAQELLIIIGAYETFRSAEISLPLLNGGTPQRTRAYDDIYRQIIQYGGRRYANQIV